MYVLLVETHRRSDTSLLLGIAPKEGAMVEELSLSLLRHSLLVYSSAWPLLTLVYNAIDTKECIFTCVCLLVTQAAVTQRKELRANSNHFLPHTHTTHWDSETGGGGLHIMRV